MITSVNEKTYEFRGLSTDTKPVENVGNGSLFLAMDTLEVYMFNAETKEWIKIA